MSEGNGKARSPKLSDSSVPKLDRKQSDQPMSPEVDRFASGYDFVLINGEIDDHLLWDLVSAVSRRGHSPEVALNKKLVLSVVTFGGSANAAFKIGRYIQTMYDEVICFVPSVCKSAGTLVLTAAHEVILSPFGEMGPLDVQVRQRDELWGRRSGLTTRTALADLKTHTFETFEHLMLRMIERSGGSISTRLAAEVAAKLSADLMSKIYEQVNPEALGQDIRDLSIATEYCRRLNRRATNLKPDAIDRLVHRYPSHDFVIDLEEAREVFVRINAPTALLYRAMTDHDMMQPRVKDRVVKFLTISETRVNAGVGDGPQNSGSDDVPGSGRNGEARNAGGKAPPTQ